MTDGVNTTNPFRICWEELGENESHEAALRALALALADAGVRDTSVRALVALANERRCKPSIPEGQVELFVNSMLLAAAQKRGIAMGPIDISSEEGREKLRQSRDKRMKAIDSCVIPLRAYLKATLAVKTWNPNTFELEAVWHETGETIQLPLGGDVRQLQNAVGEILGSLTSYAQAAHPKAKAGDVHRVLWDCVRGTPRSDVSNDESEPARLVRTLYEANVWVAKKLDSGSQVTEVKRLCDVAGFYPTTGVGLIEHPHLGWILIANLEKAVTQALRGHPDFGRRPPRELTKIIVQAPGYRGLERGGRFKALRWHRIVVKEMPALTSTQDDEQMQEPGEVTERGFETQPVPSVPSVPDPRKQGYLALN